VVDLAKCQVQRGEVAAELSACGKRAAIMVGRYTYAHRFKRARRELKFLRTRLGRLISDIHRKIAEGEVLKERFAESFDRGRAHRHLGKQMPSGGTCTPSHPAGMILGDPH
jgi:hypothetical protein